MSRISNFLLVLGGYDPALVAASARHFRIRYYGYGLAIMVTCIAAFFGALHTGMVYFDNLYYALLLAVLWTFIVGIIEHLIVVFTGDHNKKLITTIRFLASIVFSVMISTPLVLALCEGPVKKRIADHTQLEINKLEVESKRDKSEGERKIAAMEATLLNALNKAASEAGGAISGIRGVGPVTRRFDATATLLEKQLAEEKEKHERDLAQQESKLAAGIRRVQEEVKKDELTQFKVLIELVKEDGAIRFRFVTLWLLLLFVELLPLTLKLTTPKTKRGDYEEKALGLEVKAEERAELHEHKQSQERRRLMLERNTDKIAALVELENSLKYIKDPVLKRKAMQILEYFGAPDEKRSISKNTQDNYQVYGNDMNIFPKGYKVLVSDHISSESPFMLTTAIANHAINLCREALTNQEKIEILFNFVVNHITYDHQHDAFLWGYRNAMESYIDKRAICGESSFLIIALARVVGLKADFVLVDVDHNNVPVSHACALVCNQLVDIAYNMIDANHVKVTVLHDKQIEQRFRSWRVLDPTNED